MKSKLNRENGIEYGLENWILYFISSDLYLLNLEVNIAKTTKTVPCQVCRKELPLTQLMPGSLIRKSVFEEIQRKYPHFDSEEFICLKDLETFRYEHIRRLLEDEKGEITELDKEIINAIQNHEMLTETVDKEDQENLTLGEKLADKIAVFGGSWSFIIAFFLCLFAWMAVNQIWLQSKAFDPYPFTLLNVVLSCLAALQAPIIMMSQNRQASKDRLREIHDYKTNLKAELEIRMLHEKFDKLMTSQWQRLIEIQQIQMDFMHQISQKQQKDVNKS